MRFTLTTGMGDWRDWHAMGVAAEEAGFTSFSIPDSTFFPAETDSIYPYDDTSTVRGYIGATPFIEPIVAFTWMAAVTTRLRFFPNVMKVPVRSPIILAKLVSSLAVVSGGRFALGAGIGPWEEDFRYNNLDWAKRGELLDESLEIIAGLLRGGFYEHHGKHYDFGPIRVNPVPDEPVRVIIGGHAPPALRRAARIGDGWVSVKGSDEALKGMIEAINGYRVDYGTSDRPFEFHAGNFDFELGDTPRTLDDYRRLEEMGVTDYCILPFLDPTASTQQKVDTIRRIGDEVIAKVG